MLKWTVRDLFQALRRKPQLPHTPTSEQWTQNHVSRNEIAAIHLKRIEDDDPSARYCCGNEVDHGTP